MHYSVISVGLLDWKQPPRQKAPIFQLNCSILVAFGVEIRDFFSVCPYFDSEFGPLFAWLQMTLTSLGLLMNIHNPQQFQKFVLAPTLTFLLFCRAVLLNIHVETKTTMSSAWFTIL